MPFRFVIRLLRVASNSGSYCSQARHNVEEFDTFTLDEVDKAFEMITQLKYNQSVALKGLWLLSGSSEFFGAT